MRKTCPGRLALVAAVAVLTGCTMDKFGPITGTGALPTPVPVAGAGTEAGGALRSAVRTVELAVGEEQVLTDVLRDAAGNVPAGRIQWLSNGPSVVSVQGTTGLAKALKPGIAIVTASLPGQPDARLQLEVHVRAEEAVKAVIITPGAVALAIGGRQPLQAQVQMGDGTITANVAWSSSDDTIAVVNPTTGVVSAVKPGRVTIVAAAATRPDVKGTVVVDVVAAGQALPTLPTTPAVPGTTTPGTPAAQAGPPEGPPVPGVLDVEQPTASATIEAGRTLRLAQTFVPKSGQAIAALMLLLESPNGPGSAATVSLQAADELGKPAGPILGSGTIAAGLVPSSRSRGWTPVVFDPPVPFAIGQRYAFSLTVEGPTAIRTAAASDLKYDEGTAYTAGGSPNVPWLKQGMDVAFRVFVTGGEAVAANLRQ